MTVDAPRWQVRLRVRDLVPNARNPKRHLVEGIAESVGRFGFVEPITLDERDKTILSGHGRVEALLAAEAAGAAAPEGIEVDDEGAWTVAVVRGWASADDAEQAAALIAVNRYVELGGWDPDGLVNVLEGLTAYPDGLRGVGYEREEVASLLAAMAPPVEFPPVEATEFELAHTCERCGFRW